MQKAALIPDDLFDSPESAEHAQEVSFQQQADAFAKITAVHGIFGAMPKAPEVGDSFLHKHSHGYMLATAARPLPFHVVGSTLLPLVT